MTVDQIIQEVDIILDDKELKKQLGINRFDKQNIIRSRSIPKMLELLFNAGKLQIIDGSHSGKTIPK